MNNFDPNDTFNSKEEIRRIKKDFEPYNFSKRICAAITTQKDINIVLKDIIKDSLENDLSTHKFLKTLIKELILEENKNIWYKVITIIVGGIMAFVGGGYFMK